MMLDGVVYPPDYVTSSETRSTNDAPAPTRFSTSS